MTTDEAIVELEDWVHERDRERMETGLKRDWRVPYDARTDALRLALRQLKQDGEGGGRG